jgi:phosphohistidine phosphatase
MLELIILRHAHAGEALTDFDRPLRDKGRREAIKLGELFESQKRWPDYALVSPALRTSETFELASQTWPSCPIEKPQAIYNGSLNNLLDALSQVPDGVQKLLLVAHNPGVSYLAEELNKHNDFLGFRPADWCHMELNISKWEDIHPTCGSIISHA